MQDVLFIAAMAAFLAVCVLLVKACEKILGPDVEAAADDVQGDAAVAQRRAA